MDILRPANFTGSSTASFSNGRCNEKSNGVLASAGEYSSISSRDESECKLGLSCPTFSRGAKRGRAQHGGNAMALIRKDESGALCGGVAGARAGAAADAGDRISLIHDHRMHLQIACADFGKPRVRLRGSRCVSTPCW
jgi:hypothetical protein